MTERCEKHGQPLKIFQSDKAKVPDCPECRADRLVTARKQTKEIHEWLRAQFGDQRDASATEYYTENFYRQLKRVPAVIDGRSVSESTQRWMALGRYQAFDKLKVRNPFIPIVAKHKQSLTMPARPPIGPS